jgi:hypothetical protein
VSDFHLSRGIPVSLILVLVLAAGSCVTAKTPAPDVRTPPQDATTAPVVSAPSNKVLPFSSEGERLVYQADQYEREVRCTKGNGSKGAPVICVDNVTTRPNPYLVQVWDVEGEGGQPTNRPVIVHWFTRRTADLRLEFQPGPDGKSCVTNLVCKGGHCSARVEPLGDRPERSCKYNVWIDGRNVEPKSPMFSVVPCCW